MGARTCVDCWRAPAARGRCTYHLNRWLNANPERRMSAVMRRSIMEAMPGTQSEIAASVGCQVETVRRWITLLSEEKAIHIESHNPPTTTGTKWLPVYAAGEGEDAKLTKAMKREHLLAANRAAHANRLIVKRAAKLSGAQAWMGGLVLKGGHGMRNMDVVINGAANNEVANECA